MSTKFEKDYFVDSKDSNYVDYRHKKYDGLAQNLIDELPIRVTDKVLDFGAATGALMSSLKRKGIHYVKGTDIGLWPVNFGREEFGFSPEELQYYNLNLLTEQNDWVLMLDVLEHCPNGELERILNVLSEHSPKRGLVLRIPVSAKEGEDYVLDVSKNDRTHIQIHDKETWDTILREYKYKPLGVLQTDNIYDSEGVLARVYRHERRGI